MTNDFNSEAYFNRIGLTGALTPTLQNLRALLTAHMTHIPFENLDVLLGRPPRLDLASLQDKLVRRKRGGYCFEHTTLFIAALEAMGFACISHSARVVWAVPMHEAARQHMFVTVAVEGATYVLDPGFGGPGAREPMRLADAGPEGPADASHWMHREGDYWTLRHRADGKGKSLWTSTLERDHPVDFDMANYYVATHPASLFTNNLLLNRFTPEGQIGVMNAKGSLSRDGNTRHFEIADRAALRALLIEHFDIDLPEVESLRVPAIPDWS